jgi:predicted membrane chloride channel (bestrophin family)
MSLLLSFRINQVYIRWKEARQSISGVGNCATNIFMSISIWLEDQPNKRLPLDNLCRFSIVWPYSILQVFRGDLSLDPVAASLLSPSEMKVYRGSRKGRQVVATAIRQLVKEADLKMEQFTAIEALVQSTIKASGDALRIKFQAMPQGLTLMCSGFVLTLCLLLPFGLSNYQPDIDWKNTQWWKQREMRHWYRDCLPAAPVNR